MIAPEVKYGSKLIEGKTKILYEVPEEETGYAFPASQLALLVKEPLVADFQLITPMEGLYGQITMQM